MSTIAMPQTDQEIIARRQDISIALEGAAPSVVISDAAETLAYECDTLTAYLCPPITETEAVLKSLPKPQGARPILIGFDAAETAAACVAAIIKSGPLPLAIEYMDRLCISVMRAFSGADYPETEALLIVEVDGSEREIDAQLDRIAAIARDPKPVELRQSHRSAA